VPPAREQPLTIAVVMAAPYPALQGSQVLVRQLAEGLARRGHRVHLVTYGADPDCISGPVVVHRIPQLWGCRITASGPHPGKILLDALLTMRLLAVVRRAGADLIHAHNYEAAIAALLVGRLSGRPVVYHGHSAMGEELPTYFAGAWLRAAAARLGAWLDRHVPCRADYCIAVTDELAKLLQARGVSPGGVECVAPARIDLDGREPRPRQCDDAPAGGEGGGVLLYTGNLDRYQNLEFLLRSFRRVRAARPRARLLVVTHAEGRRYRRRVRELGEAGVAIRLVRDFPAARALIADADVALCPRTEGTGFPIKVLNYMAAAKAIVACEGSAKLLRNGETALVVANDDERAFAAATIALLDDRAARQRLGARARAELERLCASEPMLERVEDIYRRVLATRRPAVRSEMVATPQPWT
jgi:glycosyltransferase involved in cell wall biosynthesis